MNNKTLITLHPSMSYLGRCLNLSTCDQEFILIKGPSILRKANFNFQTYLRKYISNNLSNIKLVFLKINFIEFIVNFRVRNLHPFHKEYLKDAILDSILRKRLSSRIYYKIPSKGKSLIFSLYKFYAYICLSYYRICLKKASPKRIFFHLLPQVLTKFL